MDSGRHDPAREPFDLETARACGVLWLRAETAPAGAFGRAALARERPFAPGDEAAARRAIADCAALASTAGAQALEAWRRDLARLPDLGPAVARARAGETLPDGDFAEALRFAEGLRALATTAGRRGVALGPALDPESLSYPRAFAPGSTATHGFYLADAFDPALAEARGAVEVARTRADLERGRIEAIVLAVTGRAAPRAGEFVLMRDRLNGPLPRAIRVVREAATYLLCETVLDDAALAAVAAFERAQRAAAAAEETVRERLTAAFARDAAAILAAIAAAGVLDVAVAKAAFVARYATCVPEIADAPVFEADAARYLPLAGGGAPFVPLDLVLRGASVLTGPNMGGKTTALRTAGFLAACITLGLPVPATRARLSLFARVVWIAPGESDAATSGLSAFGAEIVRVRSSFERSAERALVLIDEFARTTTPHEGRALLVALIEGLRARGALVFAATHASGVAAAAGAAALAVAGLREALPASAAPLSLAEALRAIGERMDYRIVRSDLGAASRSDAIALARALGFDAGLADRADAVVAEGP